MCEQANAAPDALDVQALSKRLLALAGEERQVQAEFLRHLDALDRRRGFAELGYSSLWEYCLRALHLREGSAGRRIGAMRVLRRFPQLEPALRDGRLCLTTLCQLAPALTDDNFEDLAGRAALRTKAEVEELVASVRPRNAPADGLRLARRLAPPLAPGEAPPDTAVGAAASTPRISADLSLLSAAPALDSRSASTPQTRSASGSTTAAAARLGAPSPNTERAELHAVTARTWSLRVTLDADGKRDLETLTALLSHKLGKRDLSAVLKEALRCAVEKHGKRRGAVAPRRPRGAKPAAQPLPSDEQRRSLAASRTIPAAVRREVWARDGGRCTFVAPDGTRCGSRERLELDHVQPFALGGAATADNLRLRCRTHNLLHAEQDFGRAHMARFRSRAALPAPPHRASATHGAAATHGPAP